MGFFSAIKNFLGKEEPEKKVEQGEVERPKAETASTDFAETPETVEGSSADSDAVADDFAAIKEEIGVIEDDLDSLEKKPEAGAENTQASSEPVEVSREAIPVKNEAAPARGGNDELLARLRQADPRLSAWLGIVLEQVDTVDDLLWSRLRFLFAALEAPDSEVDEFLADFRRWLERMEYSHVDEFRSELQYRLALALDLEDEEDERARLILKLKEGLARTREQFGKRLDTLFSGNGELDQDFWDELEELFIMADLGYDTSVEMVKRLRDRAIREKAARREEARGLLRKELEGIFRRERRISAVNKPEVALMIGVNGVGKTTTIAKLAYRDKLMGKKALIVAADTFRAAAIEQLQVWAERVGVEFFSKPAGSDPASVAWEAMEYAKNNNFDVVYVDTAGRLQTKVNLMEELGKIRQVLAKKHMGAPHRSILVLDATTGQNAISQAKLFREAAGADELILTKLDGTAKGGVAIAVAMRERLPITFVGLGEKMEDLRPFDGDNYAAVLLGENVER